MNWQQSVTDPDEIKVFMALDGPDTTWRTMSGIARQTGLSEERVAQILAKYNLKLTRLSESPSISGSALVGLIEKVGA
jgi:DNA-directed RNA polymerase sigma subunit (sigma70/sigma32)